MTASILNLLSGGGETKALPHNLEAEQALLGCVLYDNDAYQFAEDVEPQHFSEPFHGRMWSLMTARIGRGALAEPITIANECGGDPAFADMGGLPYLADLLEKAPPARNARDYAVILQDTFIRRELVRVGREAEGRANDPTESGRQHLEAVEGELFNLAEEKQRDGGFSEFGTAIDGALQMAAEAYQRDGTVSGLSTGLIDLDAKLGGLHPSDLVILAGRPSMGKTALATNIAYSVARAYAYEDQPDGTRKTVRGGRVGFFSLEMSKEQLGLRLLAEVSGISSDRIRKGEIDANEFRRLHDAGAEIRSIPLHIDESGGLSIAKLAGRARRQKRRHGLDLIVVDYLQLASGTDRSRGSGRVQEVSEITQALKALAKELGVPVLALSQLSRQVENRDDKRPMLSDLRESGSIEQDADVVMFVYREEYYLSRTEPKAGTPQHLDWEVQMAEVANQAEVIIGKQRHGPIGAVKLHFNADLTKFGNLAREPRYAGVRQPYGADA